MRKKLVKVPFPTYLYKFLEREGTIVTGLIDIKKRHYFPLLDDGKTAKKYFDRNDESEKIVQVYTQDPRPIYLFAMLQYYKAVFVQKLINHIAAREGIVPNQIALKDFLDIYDISFDEYKLETGYKNWQRSPEYFLLKKNKRNEQHQSIQR